MSEYPTLCPVCERHVIGPYEHHDDCENWGKIKSDWVNSNDRT